MKVEQPGINYGYGYGYIFELGVVDGVSRGRGNTGCEASQSSLQIGRYTTYTSLRGIICHPCWTADTPCSITIIGGVDYMLGYALAAQLRQDGVEEVLPSRLYML